MKTYIIVVLLACAVSMLAEELLCADKKSLVMRWTIFAMFALILLLHWIG